MTERLVHRRLIRATAHAASTSSDPGHSIGRRSYAYTGSRSPIHLSALCRMRKIMLAGAHGHANEQERSGSRVKRRHNLPIMCAHSLRVNFIGIGAASLNLFTTTAIRCLVLLVLCAGAGNVKMSNGHLRAMLEFLWLVYHRLPGSRTLERCSVVCSCRAVISTG